MAAESTLAPAAAVNMFRREMGFEIALMIFSPCAKAILCRKHLTNQHEACRGLIASLDQSVPGLADFAGAKGRRSISPSITDVRQDRSHLIVV